MKRDVIVIGCGPAGLSAAINVRQRGGSVLCVGTAADANPLYRAERIGNYPGLPDMSGKEILERFEEHALKAGVEIVRERVLGAVGVENGWFVTAGTEVYESYVVAYAGGAMRGKPYPGEVERIGKGTCYCASCDGLLYKGKDVAVIGFSKSDEKEAEFLRSIGCRVRYFEKPRRVEIFGDGKVEGVRADGEEVPASAVFVLRPTFAVSDLFQGLDTEDGFVMTDEEMRTNLPGLFAAGDCAGGLKQIAKAVGEGLIAGQAAADAAAEMRKRSGKD